MQEIDDNYYYKTKEVASLLRLSESTVYRMARRGDLPSPIQLSRSSVRWSKRSIDNFITAKTMYSHS
jgi:excisionase family DNA binding protein